MSNFPTSAPSFGLVEKHPMTTPVDALCREVEAIGTGVLAGKTKSVDIPISAFTKADGTPLAVFAADNAGTVGLWGDGTKVVGLRWNNTAGTTETVATNIKVPADMDVAVAPTVRLLAAKIGATAGDTPYVSVGAYAQTPAALFDAGSNLGGNTAAMANELTKTLQALSKALSVVPGTTSALSVTLNPQAAKLGTDDLLIVGVVFEYQTKLA